MTGIIRPGNGAFENFSPQNPGQRRRQACLYESGSRASGCVMSRIVQRTDRSLSARLVLRPDAIAQDARGTSAPRAAPFSFALTVTTASKRDARHLLPSIQQSKS